MATVSDLSNTTLSGLNHIDALLDIGPDWNYLTPAGNTILYTFSVTSGNEAGKTGQEGFTLAQQANVRAAFDYISKLTGIVFAETAIGTNAQIHLCNTDLDGANTTGLCSWQSAYNYDSATNKVTSYDADAWVYLDNVEWRAENRDLGAGGYGYQTLLHELGHALGLKHPFDDAIHLPAAQDNTANTLMSYTDTGTPYAQYSQYDVAALKWIYGGDGLAGDLGINSATGARYITGTSGADTLTGTQSNDTLEGDGGNDMLYGGNGTDTAVFQGARADYSFGQLANGDLKVTGPGIDGVDTLDSVETLRFSDGSYQRADLLGATAHAAPTLHVATTANGNQPAFSGTADANTTIELVRTSDGAEIARTTAGANGAWAVSSHALPDGAYDVRAVSVDAAGNQTNSASTASFSIASSLNQAGTAANNSFTPGAGNNAIDGQAGLDTVVYHSARANFTVSTDGLGHSVTDNAGTGGHDSLVNVERIEFSDGALALDVDGTAGQAFRLYQAAFDRPAEADGLGYWLWRMDGGTRLLDVANEFTKQPEFNSLYGQNPTDADFIGHLYNNVLHRAPEGDGYNYWMNVLETHGATRAQVLTFFSESAENQAQVIGSIQDGMAFTPFHG